MTWSKEEVDALSMRFGISPGCKLYAAAEDFHFPEQRFLETGYTPPGGYVKDFGMVLADGRLHLFHIDGRVGELCWITGNEISFGHASTSDGTRWIRHRMPLAVGERSWESEHIWAPYVHCRAGVYYMFYMGSGNGETYISYATSTNLERWSRWQHGPIRCAVGRDPFVCDHDGKTLLLYTGHGSGRVSGCVSHDMIAWEPTPDLIDIPGKIAAESCSRHRLKDGRHVLWFNDYGPDLAGFRAAYAISDDPMSFAPDTIREFDFVTDTPGAAPSPELPIKKPVPLSIELLATCDKFWFVAYFRWQVDRNRLFFGVLDWTTDPAVIRELNDETELQSALLQVGLAEKGSSK